MGNANQFAGGKFLKPADLKEPIKTKVIECNEGTDFNAQPCLVLTLDIDGEEKKFTLNKTNVRNMIDIHGDDFDKWGKKEIGLSPAQYEFEGETGPTIELGAADDLPF